MAGVGKVQGSRGENAGLSLLFAAGERPSLAEVERILKLEPNACQFAQVGHRPPAGEGWVELLSRGLAFDVTGLAPATGDSPPKVEHQFGIALDPDHFDFEAITIRPGTHVAGGGAMLPVVRTMAGIAIGLATALAVKAVCWRPIDSWMEPGYFTRLVANWLDGGAFPALGLTAVRPHRQGGVLSHGLSFFTGQEVQVEAAAGEPGGETTKRAVRAIDQIIRDGPVTELLEMQGPSGEMMLAEPSHDGRIVRVWKSSD